MEKSSLVFFFDEMRLKRSLRSLRLLRLLRSLRQLKFLMPGNDSVCKVHAVFFSFLEAREAVQVIEASAIIMSVEVIEKFSEPLRVLKYIM